MSESTDGELAMVNPDFDRLESELQIIELMMAGYVGSIIRAAKLIPNHKWNWSFSERTPTPREICEHTFLWLWCDRQQVSVIDRSLHKATPNLPSDQASIVRMLEEEAIEWRRLVRSLTVEQLDEERESWPGEMRLVRSFLFHTGQNVIYKTGQMWMLAFELGLDGDGPYSAPFPNEIYGFPDVATWPSPRG